MGLLDLLSPGSDGGGLLDFLKANANAAIANTPTGAPGDMAQYGAPSPMGTPTPQSAPLMAANPTAVMQAPAAYNAPPTPAAAPIAPPPAGNPLANFFNHGADALGSISRGGSLLGAVRGQYDDPLSVARRTGNLTAQALVKAGVDPQTAIAAVQPGNSAMLGKLFAANFGPENWKVVQTGQDAMGNKTFGMLNPLDGTVKPIPGAPTATTPGSGLGDMSKTGQAYLDTLPKAQSNVVLEMVQGKIQPPSTFALSKPYWQSILTAARQYDPNFDEATWRARWEMAHDIGKSSPSSIGGILSNGKSAFEHLSTLSDRAVALGNDNGPPIPGGSVIGKIENYIGNSSPSNEAKVTGLNDAAQKYGQEATKFYAGTGGGEAERMAALKAIGGNTTSVAQAAFLQTERDLMLARLKQKESQVRDVMGATYLAQHPIMTPELHATLTHIDQNIAKLRGEKAPATAAPTPAAPATGAPPSIQDGQIIHNPSTGETLIRQNGQWVPYS
ncbi:MAG TPA: hypothetical protein VFX37_15090 [Pseudolabrys sp.]|nr:hypothetical protein [Pseudolabrys sp.]